MDLVAMAKEAGFDSAGTVRAGQIECKRELRDLCTEESCADYATCWSCPPGCGSFEACAERIAASSFGVVVQSVFEGIDFEDEDSVIKARDEHNGRLDRLAASVREASVQALEFSTGGCDLCNPCSYPAKACLKPGAQRHALSAHGIDVAALCERAGLDYAFESGTLRYVGMLLLTENCEDLASGEDSAGWSQVRSRECSAPASESTVIVACENLKDYVRAAQEACHTDFPVVLLDRSFHIRPAHMRDHVIERLGELPEDVETVLVAMGFCGGSWEDIECDKRLVIPRIDDCISIVLTTTDEVNQNPKQVGHFYMYGTVAGGLTVGELYDDINGKRGPKTAQAVIDMMYEGFRSIDVVDTGVYDCHDPDYLAKVQRDADLIGAEIEYVPGSNVLLEKLVSGRWDDQFLVVEPGERITTEAVFEWAEETGASSHRAD